MKWIVKSNESRLYFFPVSIFSFPNEIKSNNFIIPSKISEKKTSTILPGNKSLIFLNKFNFFSYVLH